MPVVNMPEMYYLSLNISKILCIMTQSLKNKNYQSWKRRMEGMMEPASNEHILYARYLLSTVYSPLFFSMEKYYVTLRLEEVASIS